MQLLDFFGRKLRYLLRRDVASETDTRRCFAQSGTNNAIYECALVDWCGPANNFRIKANAGHDEK